MTKHRTSLSITPAQLATLRQLAQAVGFDSYGGNASDLLRSLADAAERQTQLFAVALAALLDFERDGDNWRLLAALRPWLPAIDLSAPRDPIVRDEAGAIVAVKLYDAFATATTGDYWPPCGRGCRQST